MEYRDQRISKRENQMVRECGFFVSLKSLELSDILIKKVIL